MSVVNYRHCKCQRISGFTDDQLATWYQQHCYSLHDDGFASKKHLVWTTEPYLYTVTPSVLTFECNISLFCYMKSNQNQRLIWPGCTLQVWSWIVISLDGMQGYGPFLENEKAGIQYGVRLEGLPSGTMELGGNNWTYQVLNFYNLNSHSIHHEDVSTKYSILYRVVFGSVS